jgi:hypothetical protein
VVGVQVGEEHRAEDGDPDRGGELLDRVEHAGGRADLVVALTRKIARHQSPNRSPLVSAPPMIGEATAESPITGPKAANAFCTS